jgi:hypothetical protein
MTTGSGFAARWELCADFGPALDVAVCAAAIPVALSTIAIETAHFTSGNSGNIAAKDSSFERRRRPLLRLSAAGPTSGVAGVGFACAAREVATPAGLSNLGAK